MKYHNYRKRVLEKMGKYRLLLSPNRRGTYRKREYEHILPKDCQDLNIIDKGYKCSIEEFERKDKAKRHPYFSHLNSSQALTLNLFGPLRHEHLLTSVLQMMEISTNAPLKGMFEKKGIERSNFDFYIESVDIKVFFEVKYTEYTILTKSKAEDNDLRWKKYYKDPMNMILNDESKPSAKDKFFNQYQLWRNISVVCEEDNFSCFVFSKLRSDLEAEVANAKQLLKPNYASRVKVLYIEDICKKILETSDKKALKDHYTEFKEKYITNLE
ncbi:hypothetical protein QYZ87_01435 [Porphyromonadaceae bacterium W3.11]|nr:hypothetical protein [Porphyromonadaceae bacterium W3.11]